MRLPALSVRTCVVASALAVLAPVRLATAVENADRPLPAGGSAPLVTPATPLPPVDAPLPADDGETAASPARREPAGQVTVIDATQAAQEAKDAAQLLAPAPSVVMRDAGGVGQTKSLSLRGAAPNGVMVLLDGIPLGGTGGTVDVSRLPSAIIDRLEVFRGAGSRYGPGALGGVVNVVTRRTTEGARVFADAAQGSFSTTLLSAGASGAVLGGEALVVVHGARSLGDFTYQFDPQPALAGSAVQSTLRQNNDALVGGGLLKYRASLPKQWSLDALFEGHGVDRGLAGPVQNPTPLSRETAYRVSGALRATKELDAGQLQLLTWGRLDGTTLRGGQFGAAAYRQTETAAGAEAVFTRLLFERHGLTALLSGAYEGLAEPTGQNPRRARVSAMVQDQVLFFDGALSLDASLRLDVTGPFVGWSPRGGLTAHLPYGFEIKASGGQAHRPPSFQELYLMQGALLPNSELLPERALQVDGSVGYRHEKGALSVGGFYGLYENLITYEYYPPFLSKPYNLLTASVSGLEVEGQLKPWPWLSAAASYTYLVSQNLRDDPRYYLKSVPFRPRHKVSARAAVGPDWLRGKAEVLYQSEQFMNRTERLTLPARTFVNVGLASTPFRQPQVTVALEVKNLLDVQSADLDGYPLPPRSVFVTLALAWGSKDPSR